MTVNELIAKLQSIASNGYGNYTVCMDFHVHEDGWKTQPIEGLRKAHYEVYQLKGSTLSLKPLECVSIFEDTHHFDESDILLPSSMRTPNNHE